MHHPQSQNKNVNNMSIVGNHVHIISEKGGVKSRPKMIMCRVDCRFPDHMTGTCVRTDTPLPIFYLLVAYLN